MDIVAEDLVETKRVLPTVRLIDLAHEKAKEVFDGGFHLTIAQVLLFFQHRNCELNENVANSIFDSEDPEFSLNSLYECDLTLGSQNMNSETLIALAIASYGATAVLVVIVHVFFIKDQDKPPVQNYFDWTDRFPLIDSLLEIPICLCIAPLFTICIWLAYLACCVGLICIIIGYKDAEHEGGNLSAFAMTACLVGFDLYRLTGDICQYYVISKSADDNTRKKEQKIINKLTIYVNKSGVDKGVGKE